MKSKIAFVAVLACLALGAGSARADLTGISTANPGEAPSTDDVGVGAQFLVNNNILASPLAGGTSAEARFSTSAVGTVTLRFGTRWDSVQHSGNKDFILWMGENVGGGTFTATLTEIEVRDVGGDAQFYDFSQVLNLSTNSAENVPNRVYLQNADALGATVGTPDLQNFSEVYFTIEVTGPRVLGDRLNIDYVSNPEPGTLALFGLGLVGLGGIVVRRRRKLIAAQDANDTDVD